ncbi:AlpA family phage regulatory protein [Pseudomonas sp. 905_Psudmo1]|nr:AlpA family phage regulatory protein [Pseudomonas sp. 905_Psudmo1]WFS21224.1 AlpA family phage regulatory protein [Pseudomonas sp. 905_Psudmo1]
MICPEKTIIRIPEVTALTGLARNTIYKRLKGDPSFPKPVPLSDSKLRGAPVGWVLAEVQAWISSQITKRDQE